MDFRLFSYIGGETDSLFETFIVDTAASTASNYVQLGIFCIAIYLSAIGYLMIAGRVDKPFEKFILDCSKFLIISAFALNIDTYLNQVVPLVRGFEESLSSTFSGFNGSTVSSASVYTQIDATIQKGIDLSLVMLNKAAGRDFFDYAWIADWMVAGVIMGCTLWLSIPAGTMIMLAKFLLAILLGIGPIFIMLLMFKPTARFFDSWIGAVVTQILTIALILAVFSGVAMMIFTKIIGKMNLDDSAFFSCVVLIATTAVMTYLIKAVYNQASALGGGIASEFISAGQAMRGVKNSIPRRSPRQPKNDQNGNGGGGKVTNNSSYRPPWHDAMMKNRNKDRG